MTATPPLRNAARPTGPSPDRINDEVRVGIPGASAAMRRAAERARQIAQQTGTDLIVVRNGQVVRAAPFPKV